MERLHVRRVDFLFGPEEAAGEQGPARGDAEVGRDALPRVSAHHEEAALSDAASRLAEAMAELDQLFPRAGGGEGGASFERAIAAAEHAIGLLEPGAVNTSCLVTRRLRGATNRTDQEEFPLACQVAPFMQTGSRFHGWELGLDRVCARVDVNALLTGVGEPRADEDVVKHWNACLSNGPAALQGFPKNLGALAKGGKGGKGNGNGGGGGGKAAANGGGKGGVQCLAYAGRPEQASSHVHVLEPSGPNLVLEAGRVKYWGSQYHAAGVSLGCDKSRACCLWNNEDMAVDKQDKIYPLSSPAQCELRVQVRDIDRVAGGGNSGHRYLASLPGFHPKEVELDRRVGAGRPVEVLVKLKPKRLIMPGAAVAPKQVYAVCI